MPNLTNVINPFITDLHQYFQRILWLLLRHHIQSLKCRKCIYNKLQQLQDSSNQGMLVCLDKKSPTFFLCCLNGSLSSNEVLSFSNCSSLFAFLSVSDASLFASSIFFFSAATFLFNSFSTADDFLLNSWWNLDAIANYAKFPQEHC